MLGCGQILDDDDDEFKQGRFEMVRIMSGWRVDMLYETGWMEQNNEIIIDLVGRGT